MRSRELKFGFIEDPIATAQHLTLGLAQWKKERVIGP